MSTGNPGRATVASKIEEGLQKQILMGGK